VEDYIAKSDAVLIGPGFMRFGKEKTPLGARDYKNHEEGRLTREITKKLLAGFPTKRWVIDAGSLQVMEADWIPQGAIVTPNVKEYKILFGEMPAQEASKKYNCVIIQKGAAAQVTSPEKSLEVRNGNPGLTKGGTGDVLAGLAVSLYAKNEAFLAACSASYITKAAADELYASVGTNFNADDLADKIPETFFSLTKQP
jgi:NAD(P)H-hydrate epimerase